jgi:hypothetical protein
MLDTDWPDQLPSGFAQEYGLQRLRDAVTLDIPAHFRQEARNLAEESVGAIKKEVFPKHDLGG